MTGRSSESESTTGWPGPSIDTMSPG
jgi:hypothetical protein